MRTASPTLTVKFDGDNRHHYLRPAQRVIRGRFDLGRDREPGAMTHLFAHTPIPGQSIRLNLQEGIAEIIDHLLDDDDEAKAARAKIRAKNMALPEARESLGKVSVDSYVHYLKLACDAGYARLVEGEFPDVDLSKVSGIGDRPKSVNERLAEGIEQLTGLLQKVLAKV
jgi:hypothetical protein